jgi:hypothetical protein
MFSVHPFFSLPAKHCYVYVQRLFSILRHVHHFVNVLSQFPYGFYKKAAAKVQMSVTFPSHAAPGRQIPEGLPKFGRTRRGQGLGGFAAFSRKKADAFYRQADCSRRRTSGGRVQKSDPFGPLFQAVPYYSWAGAPTGQVPAQAPHSMHLSGSITYLPSPSEIASTGHSDWQAPHMMHSSEITYAIVVYLLY